MSLEKKKFKRLTHMAIALSLEMEEIMILDDKYGEEFSQDFSEESAYSSENLASQDGDHQESSGQEDIPAVVYDKIEGGPGKTLHRALARKTHPDITGDEEEFKKIQAAYDDGDMTTLLIAALENNIEVEFTLKELEELETKIKNQESQNQEIKKSIRWAWALSEKTDAFRSEIHRSLGINTAKFKEWKNSKSV